MNLLQNYPRNLLSLYSKIVRTVRLPVSYSNTVYSLIFSENYLISVCIFFLSISLAFFYRVFII